MALPYRDGLFDALVITDDGGDVIAMAIVQESFRTFSGNSLYLQDLIDDASCRGRGLGTLMLQVIAASALRRGCNRLFWESVSDSANRANAFYADTIGAEQVTCHLNWRLEGEERLRKTAGRLECE